VIDKALLAKKVAAIRDAVERIRSVMPFDPNAFVGDRTAREVVVLNLFVALQECVSLAAHALADAGLDVPGSYGEIFLALAHRGSLDRELAGRLAAASGLRNLIAHRYGVLDWERIHELARSELDDLLLFCEKMATGAPP
jgi:uncharacterized protein YutE (UPF0331/DUF86 family)